MDRIRRQISENFMFMSTNQDCGSTCVLLIYTTWLIQAGYHQHTKVTQLTQKRLVPCKHTFQEVLKRDIEHVPFNDTLAAHVCVRYLCCTVPQLHAPHTHTTTTKVKVSGGSN